MGSGNNLSKIFAYIGGVAGFSSIIFNCYKLYIERRKIEVDGGIGTNSKTGEKALIINATNFGRRPIRLIGVCIKDKKKFFERYLPVTNKMRGEWHLYKPNTGFLTEGNFVTIEIEDYKKIAEGESKYIYVYDSLGKKWGLKKRRLRRIIEESDIFEGGGQWPG